MSDTRQALAAHRKRLKIKLWQERGRYPACSWCGEIIVHPRFSAMHEWLIKRNQLPVKYQVKIMHKYNCVLAHNDCHDKHGQTVEFKMRCAVAQYTRYGRDKIVIWVASLELRQTIEIPGE